MSVARPMGILQKLSTVVDLLASHGPLTPAEIAEHSGIPRASVYRLLDALAAIGLTEALPTSQARLSLRWLRLADAASTSMSEWSGADDILRELARNTGLTTYLCVPRPSEAVCIRWAQGSGIGVLVLRPGRSLPLHAGAAGRLCLAYRVDVENYLALAPFPAFTQNTLVSAAALSEDIAATRARGYSISDEDVTEGVGALGAAVRAPNGRLAGAVSLAGLVEDIRSQEDALVDELYAATAVLTDQFST
jgi:IclR family transcriptional regulator, acetate operon repressor